MYTSRVVASIFKNRNSFARSFNCLLLDISILGIEVFLFLPTQIKAKPKFNGKQSFLLKDPAPVTQKDDIQMKFFQKFVKC